ncbi:NYN domain-containing protein [Paenibacillus rhizovicinus]|uniref:NYN domain-containing protein n=1 Tax=Paenibacillus rhizovicinus TaxID=2704463 RepID=A0A6C0P491_9BACL|nr:NYN domain-containing protein [Paenibacillus rhizovicinus]QHW32653.1 NYN domain-containing protein [Paenibacillus rhizovicinus]
MRRRDDVLLVDGYNMIGAWPELAVLRDKDLEDARDRLLELLADYQGFTGMTVVVVFDAHQVPGVGSTFKQHRLTVVYTKEKETADACIERLASELAMRSRNIHVATSDLVEQHVAFGKGALRISARELLIAIKQNRKAIEQKVEQKSKVRNELDGNLSMDIRMKLENWRRGKN